MTRLLYKARGYRVVIDDPHEATGIVYVAWWRTLLIRLFGKYGL